MTTDAIRNLRIGEGGLLRRFESAAHLTRLPQQILTALAITWFPVVALSLLNERLTGLREPLVHAPSLHVRLLVAMPVLLILDHVFPRSCRSTLEQLASQSFVPAAAEPRFERILRSAMRMADSLVPELLMAALALGFGVGALAGVVPKSGLPSEIGLTAAHVWYALADGPLLQFLLWRSLWRWAIWVRVLIGLARIELDLVPSHPDRRGGISFLRLPSLGYCSTLLFAISSVLCADQAPRFTFGGTLASYTPLLLVFGIVGALIAFGPLLLFSPQLIRLRRRGVVEYAGLGSRYGRRFERAWIHGGEPPDRLEGRDTQPLADLGSIYRDTVDRLRPLMFDGRDLVVLLVATLIPLVPVMLLHVPREDWSKLLGLLTGGALR
jgi:hypothetical protein